MVSVLKCFLTRFSSPACKIEIILVPFNCKVKSCLKGPVLVLMTP